MTVILSKRQFITIGLRCPVTKSIIGRDWWASGREIGLNHDFGGYDERVIEHVFLVKWYCCLAGNGFRQDWLLYWIDDGKHKKSK